MAADILGSFDNNQSVPPVEPTADDPARLNPDLATLVPDNPNRPYDMVKVIEEIVDDGIFMELSTPMLKTSLLDSQD